MQAKKTISEQYDTISWLLRIFLGGTINIGILNATYAYIVNVLPTLPASYQAVPFLGLVIIAITMPLTLSLILTASQHELRVVPPFYIASISWTLVFVLWVNPTNGLTMITPTTILGILYASIGYAEDWVTTQVLGITTERENIYYEHLTVYAEINDVKARLAIPEIRRCLCLSERIEGNVEQGYLLKTKGGFTFRKQILVIRNKESPLLTDIKIVYYEKGRYCLRVSSNFLEEARETSAYLKDILYNRNPKLGFAVIIPFTNTACDTLIDRVIDDMQGYYARSKQLSNVDRFKIAIALLIIPLTVTLFLIEQPLYAALSIAIEVLLAVSQLPDIIRRQKE